MDLVLYVADPASVPRVGASPPSAICESLLVAKALPFRRVALSYERGEHKTGAMLALNPRGAIPVLTDGDAVVHETFAIMLYVESLAPGHLPADGPERARALTRFFETEYLKSASMKALASLMRTGALGDTTDLATELDRWDGVLAVDAFAAGSSLTLADFVLFGYVETLGRLGWSFERWPHVAAWAAKLSAAVGSP